MYVCLRCMLATSLLQVPSPRDISDEELQQLVQSGDGTKFRVPLSLGEPHTEKDNGKTLPLIKTSRPFTLCVCVCVAGKDCQTYDVIVSSSFFDITEV